MVIFKKSHLILIVLVFFAKVAENSEILGIFPVQSRSHNGFNKVIMKTLASRGHQVTVMSYFPENKPLANYTEIDLLLPESGNENLDYVDTITVDYAKQIAGFYGYLDFLLHNEFEDIFCESVLSHPHIQNIIHSINRPPDLMILEILHTPYFVSVAKKFNIPVVAVVAPLDLLGLDYAIGNPIIPSYIPNIANGFTQNMNFYQRLINAFQQAIFYIANYWYSGNRVLKLDDKYVGNVNIDIYKLYERIDLVLYNSHSSIFNRPLVPNAIEIGGIHIQDPKPLQQDLKKFIEESEHGAIFFSFGTTVKASSLPKEQINMFKDVFSKIPQRVIWRCDAPNMTDVSENILIGNWFPQRDILDHKNVKAFISHGGIFGTFEAIYTGTPVVGIPFIFDQFLDIRLLQEKDAAIYLDYDSMTHQGLLNALTKIINDPKYSKNMQKLSQVFKDRPMSPLDTAMYWIEYVLRYNGAHHLRSKAADMTFYQYLSLDIFAFLTTIFFGLVYLLKCSFEIIFGHRIIKHSYKKKIQ